jgi:hypothetical protein
MTAPVVSKAVNETADTAMIANRIFEASRLFK